MINGIMFRAVTEYFLYTAIFLSKWDYSPGKQTELFEF